VHLGDVGEGRYIAEIHAGHKVLILGNHDKRKDYQDLFDEVYDGPLFITPRILLSHEPVYGLPWCLNIHGHDHNAAIMYQPDSDHLNVAANVCAYTPVNLGRVIKDGILSGIPNIHRFTIDGAREG
jgi:calcineurin-like phosphoesterase family protein